MQFALFFTVVFKEFDLILHLGRINTWWNILEVWFLHGSSFSRHLIINLLIAILLVCFKFFIIAKSTSICVLLHKALHFRSCFGIDSWKRKYWIKLSSLFYGSWYGLIIVLEVYQCINPPTINDSAYFIVLANTHYLKVFSYSRKKVTASKKFSIVVIAIL